MICTKVDVKLNYSSSDLHAALCAALPSLRGEMPAPRILHRALMGRRGAFFFRLTVGLCVGEQREAGLLKMKKKVAQVPDLCLHVPVLRRPPALAPVVVGAGPAGLFCALVLAEAGCSPLIVERGSCVEERGAQIGHFLKNGILNPESNIQFGEGGAGAFSDGKLKVGRMDAVKFRILQTFVDAGADPDILISDHPHIGTDVLPRVIRNIRLKLSSLGVRFLFDTCLTSLTKRGGTFTLHCRRDTQESLMETATLFLATGHSARDTMRMLYALGAPMRARPFGIGVRVEHPRAYVDDLVYGADRSILGPASYHLVTHLQNGRSVYSFCMCPGGQVVAAASDIGGVVTNGMSTFSRDGENSNAALLVSLTPADFPSSHPLAGIELQQQIEQTAFCAAGSDYRAPAQRLGDFLCARTGSDSDLHTLPLPTYGRGVCACSLDTVLPSFITDALRVGIRAFEEWMPGFSLPEALLCAPETRSTSPVCVLRDAGGEIPTLPGVYPVGEGAGYAGGIVSSAADGIRAAVRYLSSLS